MVTIGLSVVLRGITLWVFGPEPKSFPGETGGAKVQLLGLNIEAVYLWSTLAALLGMAVFAWFFKYSRLGLAMRATAFNQQAAQSMGISVKFIFGLSWVISAVISGIGGVLIGNINGINTSLYHFGLKVFPATILGGLDSILGAAIGGLVIGLLENLSDGLCKAYLDLSGVKEVAPYVILVVILMIKPYGLFGTKEIERV
jgi:branched-chain amino acid transport system permease protein